MLLYCVETDGYCRANVEESSAENPFSILKLNVEGAENPPDIFWIAMLKFTQF